MICETDSIEIVIEVEELTVVYVPDRLWLFILFSFVGMRLEDAFDTASFEPVLN